MSLVDAKIAANEACVAGMARRIWTRGSGAGRRIGVLGLAFKFGTDDAREARSLSILHTLVQAGVKVRAFDPAAMGRARSLLPAAVEFVSSGLEAPPGADVLVVLADCNDSRALSAARLRDAMRGNVLLDLHNVWRPTAMSDVGFRYVSSGRA